LDERATRQPQPPCVASVRMTDSAHLGGAPLVCAECGRQPSEDENAADEWRAYLDVDDDLPVFCPECAGREFG
jgi:hypothetical protein